MARTASVAPVHDHRNFQYLWDQSLHPVLAVHLDNPLLGFPPRIARVVARVGIRRVVQLMERTRAELLAIDGFGRRSLRAVEDFLGEFYYHLAVYDARFVPPAGTRWVMLSPHPVLDIRIRDLPLSWLSRGTPEDDEYLADIMQSQLLAYIGEVLDHTQAQFLEHNWAATPESSDIPILTVEQTVAWMDELLALYGLAFRQVEVA